MRHERPRRLQDYYTLPKFCHTCDLYNEQGVCQKHKMEPPEEFASTEDACPDWLEDIPF